MWFWKLKGLSLFALGSLLFASGLLAQEPAPKEAALPLQITLVGIDAYPEFREIRTALSQMEGMAELTSNSEAPGLIILKANTTGPAASLIEKLSGAFPNRYDIKEKTLPSGGTEIVVKSRQSTRP